MSDFILNGTPYGPISEGIVKYGVNFINVRRPYWGEDGKKYVNLQHPTRRVFNSEAKRYEPYIEPVRVSDLRDADFELPVRNATTLTKEAWIELDGTIVRAVRDELVAAEDLRAASSRGGFNAMGRSTFEYQAQSDPGYAHMDMDGLTDGDAARPQLVLRSVPLPITHSDFHFTLREREIAASGGLGMDFSMGEASARRVGELIEDTTIGLNSAFTYGTQSTGVTAHQGNSSVWGYTNFTYRVTKTDLTTPDGTNQKAVLDDILEMVDTHADNNFKGPFMLYHSTDYDQYMNSDYGVTDGTNYGFAPSQTLRQRILQIPRIGAVKRLDRLTSGFQLILVQMRSDVAQMIDGLRPTVISWDEKGGLATNMKVIAIQVPLLKAPYDTISGIQHATTA